MISTREIVAHLAEKEGDGGHRRECAIGIAYGSATYGTVGSRERLDFTVIGSAANIAARPGDHGKKVDRSIVVTHGFADGEVGT